MKKLILLFGAVAILLTACSQNPMEAIFAATSSRNSVDENGYEKLPLKTQEEFLRFPAGSDSWSKNVIIIEQKEDGKVFLIKNTKPVSKKVDDVATYINLPYDGKKGKSYSIKFDLKADANCYVNVAVEDRLFGFYTSSVWCSLSNEWKTFELNTGILYEDWSNNATLVIAMGNASEVEIRNLKIKKDEKRYLPTNAYYSSTDFFDGFKIKSHKDYVEFTSDKKASHSRDDDDLAGIDIFFGVLDAGKLYKVTFDVTPDDTGNFMQVWGHSVGDEYETAGNGQLSFVRGEKKTITLYIPSYALPYDILDKNGNKTRDGFRERNISYIWFSCVDEKEHTIKVENIRYEVVENIETIKEQDNLGFYVGGNVFDSSNDSPTDEDYKWTGYKNLDNYNDDIILMPHYGIYFDYIMSDSNWWDSTETTITGFRYGADKSIVSTVNKDGYNSLYYENEKDYPVILRFGLDEQCSVTVETERFESAWYYFEFDPSEPEWSNFKEDRSNFWFNIWYEVYKYSHGFQFPDNQNVIYKDGWEDNPINNTDLYEIFDSKRDDNPEYESTNRKLRIYFYSDTSKLDSTPIPSLKTTPHIHIWDSIAEIAKDCPMTKAK